MPSRDTPFPGRMDSRFRGNDEDGGEDARAGGTPAFPGRQERSREACLAKTPQRTCLDPADDCRCPSFAVKYYLLRNENSRSLDIAFRTRKLAKTFNSAVALRRTYGARMARVIMTHLAVLRAARNLALVPTSRPERMHLLRGDRHDQYAIDLVHPRRLVFEPDHAPLPRAEDGKIDAEQVTAIVIVEVVDYH